ncbi:ROK family protein [Streptococcus cuniculi]|uniref:ROK family protein n=1 Tax=Streptococcus cuniculi TaxID=1432788 RepID=A0A4Y9J8R1_9STRE|nr:ROK family protein [Streptococcus cuniculi]MBF0778770.1 ROK family protein [Streptococcus cuniculi]TFU97272.1 ROK family protein [Streptococcus cuniculi]
MKIATKNSENILQNAARVMEFIYRNKIVSRTKIATELELAPATVTHIVTELIREEKIFETGHEIRERKGSGRSRKLLSINEEFAYLVGIEFTMRGIALVATNSIGQILTQRFIKMGDYPLENITQTISSLIEELLEQYAHLTCAGIGFSIPGHFDSSSNSVISNNQNWVHFNLNELKETFQLPISIDNNIECMALAEYLFDSEESPDKFLFLHIGPGIFCSFFHHDHIATKENYYIGELGHTIVDIQGQHCECGKRGCLQTYISDSWLIENAKLLFAHSKNTILKNLVNSQEEIDLSAVIHAYQLGDSFIVDRIEAGLQFLAMSISNTLIIYDAHKIFINSELLNQLDLKPKLIERINEQLQFIPTKNNLDVELLDFTPYRGARGACALAAYQTIVQTNGER